MPFLSEKNSQRKSRVYCWSWSIEVEGEVAVVELNLGLLQRSNSNSISYVSLGVTHLIWCDPTCSVLVLKYMTSTGLGCRIWYRRKGEITRVWMEAAQCIAVNSNKTGSGLIRSKKKYIKRKKESQRLLIFRTKCSYAAENVLLVTAVCWEWEYVSSVPIIFLCWVQFFVLIAASSSPLHSTPLISSLYGTILFLIVPFTAVRELCVCVCVCMCVCAGDTSILLRLRLLCDYAVTLHDSQYCAAWYDLMWFDMMWCDLIWCDLIWCDVIWFDRIWFDVIWYDLMWFDIILFDMKWIFMMVWYFMTQW